MPWSNKKEYNAFFQQCYDAGFVLHRADDFYKRVQLVLLGYVSPALLANAIDQNIPEQFPINVIALKDAPIIYIFTTQWKAAINVTMFSQDVCSYRFWFAEPSQNVKSSKHLNIVLEMNIAATAIGKAFLKFDKVAHVIVAYAQSAERNFEIGPQSTSREVPDITKLFDANLPLSLSADLAKGFVKDVSVEIVLDYLTERKNSKKLGYDAASDFLASRFLDTPACPPEVQAHFDAARQQMQQAQMQKTELQQAQLQQAQLQQARFCRRCGTPLVEEARFCSECGTEISSVARSGQ